MTALQNDTFWEYDKILKKMNISHINLREISDDILDYLIKILGADKAEICIIKDDFDIESMEISEENAVGLRVKKGYTLAQWKKIERSGVLLKSLRYILKMKSSRIVFDTAEETLEERKLSEYLGTGSWMNHILKVNDKVVAFIHLSKAENNYYKYKDISQLRHISLLLATAVNLSNLWAKERKLILNFIESLNRALEIRDEYTAGHTERVKIYINFWAKELKLKPKTRKLLEVVSILHDIGKIGISDRILKKKTQLTSKERELIQKHVPIGDKILENLHYLEEARKVARYHHEAVDGTGYVLGLKGTQIPKFSRILSIVDSFDAMTSNRPYRQAFYVEEAVDALASPHIRQWDKKLVKSFVRSVRSKDFLEYASKRNLIFYDKGRKRYNPEKSVLKFRHFSSFFK